MDICNNHSGLPSTKWPDVCRYEVFLSFRGGDVRGGFVEFLYEGLADSGTIAFIDHRGIEIGEHIMPKILQVIGHTQICIPIFSKDFASSRSCLKEVEKMVECDRTIMPIFYDVSPSVVGEQKESYQQSFRDHEADGVTSTTINNWKKALHSVSRKRGWELEKFQHGQRELINEVVSTVRRLLRKDDLYVTAHLVGMDQPVQEVMRKLGVGYENGEVIKGQMVTGKRVVEISGLPGIGKSTLAAVVYNKIHHLFEGKSFLKEVEQTRLLSLQEDLVSGLQKRAYTFKSPAEGNEFIKYKFGDLRVLIILDDVSDFKQINSLAGDLSWFGPGSRIIVISKRSNLVDNHNQVHVTSASGSTVNRCDDILVEKYKLKEMNSDHAFQLFCSVLREKPLKKEFSSLVCEIISAAGGIPLVIEVVGSFLRGKPIEFWKEAMGRLKREPYTAEVKRILKRRYEDLEKNAQEIFLDVACFFVGKDKAIPSYMWEACEYDPYSGINELHDLSLVKTRENSELWMNNQLKVLGRDIVKEENPSEPFKRSRLWNEEDIEPVLNERKVNFEDKKDWQDAASEALSATYDKPHLFPEHRFFCEFSKLRYLKMNHAIVKAYKQSAKSSREDFYLRRLKWLEWQGCNDISSLLALDMSKLIVLDLSRAKNLKVLILKDCRLLMESPFSHAAVTLERLNLERSTLPTCAVRSISELRNLVSLNIKFCSFVQELPKDIGSLEALKELYIDGTPIKAIDIAEGSYGKLKILSACNCEFLSLWKLPDSIGDLKKLQVMDLSSTIVDEIPSSVKDLQNLKELKMAGTHIRKFPGGIKNLESLEEIDFSGCRNLRGECNITGLSSLRVLLLEHTDISRLIVTDRQSYNPKNLKLDGDVPISIIGTIQGHGIGSTDVRLDHRSRLTDIISACDDESETVAMWRSDRSKEVIGG
ncbi:disease resistance protein RPV1 [Eucalyptus grandis]|uniref:disease resistance protein RPV1 n=1 Tax=Eucalyptus grandis TaxID=71139 RepID=UPI00192EBB36|nr:disease resistance protein RPV1 [Eucalyptus grandis]